MKRKLLIAIVTALGMNLSSYALQTQTNVQVKKETVLDEFKLYDEEGKLLRTNRDSTGKEGIVAASKYEASKIGADIIKKGGNAVDAAVATAFALSVCEPHSSGLGGGGFMTLRIAETGEVIFIDFREIAPKNATPKMWVLDDKGKVIGKQKTDGGKASGIPGEVAGLLYLLEKYGTMSRNEVLQPAIDLATNGYTVSPTLAEVLKETYDTMIEFPEITKIYWKDGSFPYETGDIIKNPDLAKTLSIIQEKGADGFYKGEVAEAIVNSVNKYDGLFTLEDLAEYKVSVRKPIVGNYRGYEIISSPPPSSGGAHLIQILNILENYDIGSLEVNSPEYLHLFSEAFKLAYADRSKYMGDTDFVKVPLGGITSKSYAKNIINKIDLTKANTHEPHNPWQYEHEDTTHFSIADKAGNMVAVTKTINGYFGSGVCVDGYGIIMNDEMDDFVTGPGHANSVEPGKKPLSSMTPTLILKNGNPFMVLGTPGGAKIFATVAQVLSKVIDHNMDIQDAISAPRIWDNTSAEINYESRLNPEYIYKLQEMGHKVNSNGEWGSGSVQGIVYMPDGTLRGGADPRRDGKALGL
ncbi:MAG: gamma-glutamyltransferase [Cetobacterium sp.]